MGFLRFPPTVRPPHANICAVGSNAHVSLCCLLIDLNKDYDYYYFLQIIDYIDKFTSEKNNTNKTREQNAVRLTAQFIFEIIYGNPNFQHITYNYHLTGLNVGYKLLLIFKLIYAKLFWTICGTLSKKCATFDEKCVCMYFRSFKPFRP